MREKRWRGEREEMDGLVVRVRMRRCVGGEVIVIYRCTSTDLLLYGENRIHVHHAHLMQELSVQIIVYKGDGLHTTYTYFDKSNIITSLQTHITEQPRQEVMKVGIWTIIASQGAQ